MTAMAGGPGDDIPAPPSPLACNLLELPAKTLLHRIHDKKFLAEEFNPGLEGNSRFAPIKTARGSPIPTSYAATSFDCAAFESIFHDIDPSAAFKSVAWAKIARLCYSTLELGRDLRLAKFFSADLMKWGMARTQLIDTPTSTYPKTRLWSAAMHEAEKCIDGLVWTSRKFDEEKAMLLFGSRLKRGDLVARSSVVIVSDAKALGDLHALARRSGILISR